MPRLIQPSFSGGEVSPGLYGRVDLAKYNTSLKTCKNAFIHAHGGVSNRPGTMFVAEALGAMSRFIPFQFNAEQGYVLEFGDYVMRVIKDGGLVVHTALTTDAWADATGYALNDFVRQGCTGTIYRCISAHTSSTADEPGVGVNWETYWIADSILRVTTPYAQSDLTLLKHTQSADTVFLTHPGYAPRKLTRTAHTAWTFTTQTFTPAIGTPATPTLTPSGGKGTGYTYEYKISAISSDGEESLPSATGAVGFDAPNNWTAGGKIVISWTAVTGAERYYVYKNANGYFGYIGSTEGTNFTDTNIEADINNGPQGEFDGFSGASDYPGVPSFFEQRLVYGATTNQPQTVWLSQTGLFNNFSTSSPLKDTDAIEATVAATQVNQVRHFVPLNKLVVLTSGAEWVMSSGQNSDALTPTSLQFKVQGYRGCAQVPPIVIGQTVLFVQRGGSKVRDLAYKLTDDAYTGSDLTVLADHLFKNRSIVRWAYQQDPESIVWCVRDDGVLLGFTYLKEHEVWAWHRHITDGEFLDVAVLEGDDNDETYFIVKRTIGTADKYYIEKLATRLEDDALEKAWFVDSGLRYTGSPVTTVSGLDHLEGETVSILADGSVQAQQVVTGGQITLPVAASTVTAGLPFVSDIETLRIDVNDAETWQGATKNIPSVTLRFWNSLGGWVGPDANNLAPIQPPLPDNYGEHPPLRTDDYKVLLLSQWNTQGSILFRQTDPLPFTLLAIIPEVELGG